MSVHLGDTGCWQWEVPMSLCIAGEKQKWHSHSGETAWWLFWMLTKAPTYPTESSHCYLPTMLKLHTATEKLIHKRSQHHSPIIAPSGNTPNVCQAMDRYSPQYSLWIKMFQHLKTACQMGAQGGSPVKNKILCSIAFRLYVRDGCEAHTDFMLKHGFCITLLTTIVIPPSHSQFEGGLHHGGERMATGAETASHTTVRNKKGWALVFCLAALELLCSLDWPWITGICLSLSTKSWSQVL